MSELQRASVDQVVLRDLLLPDINSAFIVNNEYQETSRTMRSPGVLEPLLVFNVSYGDSANRDLLILQLYKASHPNTCVGVSLAVIKFS